MAKRLNVVCVLETVNNSPIQIIAYEDNDEGNKSAERLFKRMMMENAGDSEKVNACIEDGYYSCGDYDLFLIHS